MHARTALAYLTHPTCTHPITNLEVTVDPAVGVEVAERTGERGEDRLGQSEVDTLLQQHDREVPLRLRLIRERERWWGVEISVFERR